MSWKFEGFNEIVELNKEIDNEEVKVEFVPELEINCLKEYQEHPFHLYSDSRFESFVKDIDENGVIQPIIVRKHNDGYEILAGHNRVNACKKLGYRTIKACVYESLSEEEAKSIVISTNIQQRSWSEMKHSEKALTVHIAEQNRKKKQGERSDLLKKENSYKADNYGENSTSGQSDSKLNNDSYSENEKKRYIRIYRLIEPLKKRMDNNEIGKGAGDDLSNISVNEMELLEKVLSNGKYKLDGNKAKRIRELSESNKLDEQLIVEVLNGTYSKKKGRPKKLAFKPSSKFNEKIFRKYFDENTKSEEIEDIVEDALALYFTTKGGEINDYREK